MEQFSTHNAFSQDNPAAAWLYDPDLQNLLSILSVEGDEARIVGGAVRNTLLHQAVHDIDIATTARPEQVMECAQKNGFKVFPVGIEFGTVIVLVGKNNVQITTLRADVETDGRHAKVRFSKDWAEDAQRRDFTINALYVDQNGIIYDYVNGLKDLKDNELRFIGDPRQRIEEDYLRILRFFRFYALFPQGRPERDVLKAIVSLKAGMEKLSSERIWDEFKKILATPQPFRSLLWMRTCGVLEVILAENIKWGIDAIQGLEDEVCGAIDPLLRLMTILPPREERIKNFAKRLRLSSKEKRRLLNWVATNPISAETSKEDLKRKIYFANKLERINGQDKADFEKPEALNKEKQTVKTAQNAQAILDVLLVGQANARVFDKPQDIKRYDALIKFAKTCSLPQFPVKGADLKALDYHGAKLGQTLKVLEETWIEADFSLDKQALLKTLEH